MPGTIFQRSDLRYLAAAFAEAVNHAGISAFESSFELGNSEGNSKPGRATQILNAAFRRLDSDFVILSLLNHLYIENAQAEWALSSSQYEQLEKNVLDKRGILRTDNGYALPDGGSNRRRRLMYSKRTGRDPSSLPRDLRPTHLQRTPRQAHPPGSRRERVHLWTGARSSSFMVETCGP